MGGTVAVYVSFSSYSSGHVPSLWVTDGTAAGTSELTVAGPPFRYGPSGLTAFGSEVLFEAQTSSGSFGDLWVTDGTGAGTSELSVAGASSTGLVPGGFTVSAARCCSAAMIPVATPVCGRPTAPLPAPRS
jgi:hypothetical protein